MTDKINFDLLPDKLIFWSDIVRCRVCTWIIGCDCRSDFHFVSNLTMVLTMVHRGFTNIVQNVPLWNVTLQIMAYQFNSKTLFKDVDPVSHIYIILIIPRTISKKKVPKYCNITNRTIIIVYGIRGFSHQIKVQNYLSLNVSDHWMIQAKNYFKQYETLFLWNQFTSMLNISVYPVWLEFKIHNLCETLYVNVRQNLSATGWNFGFVCHKFNER